MTMRINKPIAIIPGMIAIFFLILGNKYCAAQVSPTLIDLCEDEFLHGVTELNSNYYVVGRVYMNYPNSEAVIIKYTNSDNYTYKVFNNPDSTMFFADILSYQNRLFVTGGVGSKTDSFAPLFLIGELDENLDFVWKKTYNYPTPVETYSGSNILAKDNQLLVSGVIQEVGDYDNAIVNSYNLSGDSLHHYRFESLNSIIQDMTYSLDTTMFLVVGRLLDPTLAGGPNYAQLSFDLDSVFMEGIYSEYNGDLLSIKPDSDSTYIMANRIQEYNLPGGFVDSDQFSLRRLDQEFETTQFTHLGQLGIDDNPAWKNSMDFRTNDTVFFAMMTDDNFGYTIPNKIWIGYTNNQLETQEIFEIGGVYDYYDVRNILATSDGGCIVVGQHYDLSPDPIKLDMFILKLDPDMLGTAIENPLTESKLHGQVWPNPAQNEMHFSMEGNYGVYQVKIYNLQGKVVYQNQLNGKECQVSCKDWNSGMYLYTIHNQDGVIATGKIIKQ